MSELFCSCFSTDLYSFIQYKRSLGFIYLSPYYWLKRFDSFCESNNVDTAVITKELFDSWMSSMPDLCATTAAGAASCIRQFSLYQLSGGRESYIPRMMSYDHRRLVHILSDEEIKALFREIDAYAPSNGKVFQRLAYEYQIFFRILICCGMRVSEVRKLKKSDIDLEKGTITIRASKGQKDRLIYIPEDLRLLCTKYITRMRSLYDDESSWLFPAREPYNVLTVGIIDKRFNAAWAATKYAGSCKTKPTVHSLRHTFVVKRMNLWMQENISLESMLPYLCKYLGHTSVSDTFYYYHQVEDAFKVIREHDGRSETIIPEVDAL